MRGTILVYKPHVAKPEVRSFTRALDLGELKDAIGGGLLEMVPGFTSIAYDGEIHRCVAFCDEEGKLERGRPPMALNVEATRQWLARLPPDLKTRDYLVGQVAVVFGDDEFMEEL